MNPTRADKRRAKRALIKQINPPKYGPVIIYTEKFTLDENGKIKKDYSARTNIKGLQA